MEVVHLSRPGVWVSPDNLLFLYRVMAELCSINKQAALPGPAPAPAPDTKPINGFEVNI